MPQAGVESRKPSVKSRKPARGRAARGSRSATLDAALRRVRLFLCDVDGVLTDGAVFIGGREEIKRFNIQDGLGQGTQNRFP